MSTSTPPTSNNNTTTSDKKLKILMLHGYTQSGRLFEIKTKALKKSLEKAFPPSPKPGHLQHFPGGVELFYPTGPIALDPSDIPGVNVDGDKDASEAYGWWKRKASGGGSHTYEGMERGLKALGEILGSAEGPFDGAIGFSQGGAAVGIVASLLEPGRREAFERAEVDGGISYPEGFVRGEGESSEVVHPPLRFAVSYSGYGIAKEVPYVAFYEPKIATPMCHFLGSLDTVVEEAHSLRLVDACVEGRGKADGVPRLVYHPGGHFLPSSQKPVVAALVAFIREAVGEDGRSQKLNPEERAEDMDLPF